jgi:hypothetical protein
LCHAFTLAHIVEVSAVKSAKSSILLIARDIALEEAGWKQFFAPAPPKWRLGAFGGGGGGGGGGWA